MRALRWLIAIMVLLMIALSTFYYFSPLWTLRQMRAAAASHDEPSLSAHVDYPALRESMKRDMMKRITTDGRGSGGLGEIGAAIATAIAGPVIDAVVTPQGVETMFRADDVRKTAAGAAPPPATSSSLPRLPAASERPVIERDGLDQFRVHAREAGSAVLVFHRDGLGWRLAGIDLPPPVAVKE